MGFELIDPHSNEDLTDLQQNINLSFTAFKAIKNDLVEFSSNNDEIPFSGFLNTIIENFSDNADSSINTKINTYENELKDKLSNNKNAQNTIYFLCKDFKKTLIDKFDERIHRKKYNDSNYPNKFRINSKNIKRLNSINEPYIEDGSISLGNYLKALFEEYADFPKYKREQIYFANTINLINSALIQKKSIKIFLNQLENEKAAILLCRPYKIMHDEQFSKNYLICISQILSDDGKNQNWGPKKISSIRISRILSINIQSSVSGFISNDQMFKIENSINLKGVEFLLSDLIKIKIKFDDEGLKMLKTILYLKPNNYEKIDKYTYLFTCTSYQSDLYFPKFGKHYKIVNSEAIEEKQSFTI